MLRQPRVLVALAVTWTLSARPGDLDARQDPLADEAGLTRAMDGAIRAEVPRGFSGAVLVARGKATLLDAAYGSERGVVMRSDTRFWVASVGKQFTSAAVLRCQEKGWLLLDDAIGRFFPNAGADKQGVTVRRLLGHLSGLDQSYVSEGASDRETAVREMLALPLAGAPGKTFRYSNSNYQLAVAIVEVASGRPYSEFVRNELWRTADLRDTGFAGEPGARSVAPARGDTPPRLATGDWGGEGVYSTTHDLLRWHRALRSGRVLSPASVDRLFEAVAPIGEGEVALGWFLGRTGRGSRRIFTRGNEDFGANALVYAYPDSETVIIVLTHAGDADDGTSWSRRVHATLEALLSL
jgi:CubicO group peptidase (beta-lactamase class C family)